MKVIPILLMLMYPTLNVAAQTPALTMERAVELFLERNVEVIAARAEIDRARANQIAGRLRPNPSVIVGAENVGLTGSSPVLGELREIVAIYEENIEVGGKRRLRQEAGDLNLSVAEASFENVIREKLSELKRSYFEAVLARHGVDIAAENLQTFEQLLQFNLARFEEGAIAEGDLLRVRLERMKFDAAVRQAELALSQAMVNLLEKLEEPDFGVRPLAASLDIPVMNFNMERLKEAALESRPDLKAADLNIELATRRLSLEQANATPNISPFVGYKRIASSNTVLFGVRVPLRLRDRNQGGIARAEAEERIARSQRDVVENRVRVDVEIAFRAYQAARDQVVRFRDQLLRQADESQTITLAAYEEGATELLPVLDAQRTRSDIRQQYFQNLFDYQAAILDLERAVGREIQP
jgi:cobalt-zinc-cadmium efflux system outer membrane protein